MNSAQMRRVIVAGMIGNVLEWYDFAVYGFFAAAIGQEFFPHQDRVAQLLSAFGIFALGYLMRPLGGAVTGHIGDGFGRRAALTFSVAAMAIPTFLIGLLPGYATLGLLAPIALTLLRMVQGSFCRRRIYQLDGIPGRASTRGPAWVDGRFDRVRRHRGHPARVSRGGRLCCEHVGRRAPGLGLARSFPARAGRWADRLRPAPADAGDHREAPT